MEYVAASIVLIVAIVGIVLTAATLPGIWLMILGAVGCQAWLMFRQPPSQMFDWWTLGTCAIIALIAEVVEIFASALGAKKAGGTRRGAIGSVVGALAGALLGTMVMPILGTIAGAALGAGAGAIIAERHDGRKTWREASTIGAGAAIGRLAATVAKVAFACIVATILGVAAFV